MPKKKATKKDKDFDRRVDDFAEEVERIGKKIEKRFDEKGCEWDTWFHRTFGVVGPLISTVFGILIFGLFVWLISFLNGLIGSVFLTNIYNFLMINMGLFFLIFLFFSYTSYFSKFWKREYKPFSPLVTAIGVAVFFWLLSQAIFIANLSLGISAFFNLAYIIDVNIFTIFMFFLIIGYIVLFAKEACCPEKDVKETSKTRTKAVKSKTIISGNMKRLYRSGKDRILGGVCGGMGEYFGIDPVIIRLLFVALTLVWGVGIVMYIICWIVIPRNPRHDWKE